jgi:gas vesicle protein
MAKSGQGDEGFNFIIGLIVGVIVSAPVAAWLSPRSGVEMRQGIVQRGLIVRRRVGKTIRKPLEAAQDQIASLRGDSVEAALEEGKAIAAQQRPGG